MIIITVITIIRIQDWTLCDKVPPGNVLLWWLQPDMATRIIERLEHMVSVLQHRCHVQRLAYVRSWGMVFNCSPFSLGSIARKKIQDSQNGMNPGQDDVVIRALETSCTQPQLDVWASQMGPGCFGAIPLKAPKATWLWTVQRDFKWLWQMILPDKSGILMNFFGISGVRPVTLWQGICPALCHSFGPFPSYIKIWEHKTHTKMLFSVLTISLLGTRMFEPYPSSNTYPCSFQLALTFLQLGCRRAGQHRSDDRGHVKDIRRPLWTFSSCTGIGRVLSYWFFGISSTQI